MKYQNICWLIKHLEGVKKTHNLIRILAETDAKIIKPLQSDGLDSLRKTDGQLEAALADLRQDEELCFRDMLKEYDFGQGNEDDS